VRIDLPAGESMPGPPAGARIFNLSGVSTEADYLGGALSVDPQTLGQGSMLIVKTNSLKLVPGEAITGFLKVPGEPLTGVMLPSEAIIRTEGSGWVYVLNSGGDQFTRTRVQLDHPIETGWFVTSGVTTNDYVVVSGAQILLSEELKASLKPD
jgi:multidrug efflux pump subunit AcrA (membrane-fusion protein)